MDNLNISVTAKANYKLTAGQKIGLAMSTIGLFILLIAWAGVTFDPAWLYISLSLGLMLVGIATYTYGTYAHETKGIKNNNVWFRSLTSRGSLAWAGGILLTLFYIQLYYFSSTLGLNNQTLTSEELSIPITNSEESATKLIEAQYPTALDISISMDGVEDAQTFKSAKIRLQNTGFIHLFDPVSKILRGKAADQWFLYGTLYTFVILFLGLKFIVKYRHNRYQLIRTISVIFAQLIFAYFLPMILESFFTDSPSLGKDFKSIWPLEYNFATAETMKGLEAESVNSVSGTFYFVWGIFLFLIFTPIITYFVGKRWYCSWICGCGGLAETAGDSFRHLSSKKESVWKFERIIIHSVMVFALVMSIGSLYPYFSGNEFKVGFIKITSNGYFWGSLVLIALAMTGLLYAYKQSKSKHKFLLVGTTILAGIAVLIIIGKATGNTQIFFTDSKTLKKTYGFFIGAAFSGIAGVGFYPILGNRVWCRFGCPMAGYMGIFQRFKSKFRITTNGGQCISCGNCSVYCEQGIDVRAYAQKGENIIRSSCVGCGICSAVCPRGVLKLENGPEEGRIISEPKITGSH